MELDASLIPVCVETQPMQDSKWVKMFHVKGSMKYNITDPLSFLLSSSIFMQAVSSHLCIPDADLMRPS